MEWLTMLKNAYTGLIKPTADTANDNTVADVVGTKADTAAGTSIIARLKQILAKTDNLPSNTSTTLNTIAGYIDTEITALQTAVGTVADEENVETVMGRGYVISKHLHSRVRSYPHTTAGITLTTVAGAGVYSTPAEVVPVLANEVNTLTVTSASATAGNVTINLGGKNFVCAIAGGNAATVAGQLRALTYADSEFGDWVITGSSATVIFTRAGLNETGFTASAGGTGFTGTWVKTNTGAGIPKPFDIHLLVVGLISNAGLHTIRLYKGAAGLEEVIATRRITVAAATAGGDLDTMTDLLPAGTRISAAVALPTSNAGRTVVVSIEYHNY